MISTTPTSSKRFHDLAQASTKALEQQLFLVLDVVIHGRLGDIQFGCDVVQRGVVIAAGTKGAGGCLDDGIALAFAVAYTRTDGRPQRSCAAGAAAAGFLRCVIARVGLLDTNVELLAEWCGMIPVD